jgi:hypothetical protein
VVVGIAVVAGFFMREPLLRGGAFYERDILFHWLPEGEGFVRAIRAGSWPVWDPNVSFGHPLLAQPNTQVAYPPAWVNLVLERTTAYSVLIGLHLLWSMAGLYVLGRRYGLSAPGALTASALWAGSGPYLSFVSMWHHFMGASWLPWALLAAEAAFEVPSGRRRLLLGGCLAAQILTGSPDMCVLTAVLLGGAALSRMTWQRTELRRNAGVAFGLVVGYVAAAALTAVLWWPALDVARRAERWSLPEATRTYWSLHPAALPFLFFPLFMMDLPLRPEIRAALFESRESLLYSVYLGMPAAALQLAALACRPRPRRGWLLAVALGALLVAMGPRVGAYTALAWLLPPVRAVRYPMKALILTSLAGSLLGGMGMDAWREWSGLPSRRRLVVTAGLLALVVVGAGLLVVPRVGGDSIGARLFLPLEEAGASPARTLDLLVQPLALPTLLTAAALLAAILATRRPATARKAAVLVAVLAVADLLFTHRDLNPTAPRELLDYRPPQIDVMRASTLPRVWVYVYDEARSRVRLGHPKGLFADRVPRNWPYPLAQAFALQMYAPPPVPGRWGISGSFDIDQLGLYPRPLADITELPWTVEGTPALLRLLQIGAVTHVVALHRGGLERLVPLGVYPSLFREPIRLFGVPEPLPRAYAVGGARIADGPAALAALLDPSFDPGREVVLPAGEPIAVPPSLQATTRVAVLRPDLVRVEAELSGPAFVVLVETYDPGWRASVDGRAVPVLRANHAFRAVRAPAGRHVVEFIYRPPSVVAGLVISATALVAVLGLARLASRARTGPRHPGEAEGPSEAALM